MILREIYDDICRIFHFSYEKNRNGTVRVNTVIRQIVYPELYENRAWSDTELEYFLANPNASYQNYPNIRNSYSELMKPKCNSNRFPVLEFCERIDIDKMYSYYKKQRFESGQLKLFLDRVFSDAPSFHTKLKNICKEPVEFLVWIIIFSMFNENNADNKFEQYLKTYHREEASINIFESDWNHRFSSLLFSMKHRIAGIRLVIYLVIGFMVLISLSHFSVARKYISDKIYYIVLSVIPVFISALQFAWLKVCKKYSDYKTYFSYMRDFPSMKQEDEVLYGRKFVFKSFKHSSPLNSGRDKARNKETPIVCIIGLLTVIPSILLNSFPLFVAFVTIVLSMEILLQRIKNDKRVRTYYDLMTEDAGAIPKPHRGLAKLYMWEYAKTGLDTESAYYKNNIHVHSTTCYRHIFKIAYERIIFRTLYNHLLLLLTGVLLPIIIASYHNFDNFSDYFHLPYYLNSYQCVTLYVIAWGILSLLLTASNEASCLHLSQLACLSLYADDSPAATEHMFLELTAAGIIKETDCARGIFTYNMSSIGNGKRIEEIYPETDRISYTHRIPVFKHRVQLFSLLFCLVFFSVFVWHFGYIFAIIPILLTAIATYFSFIKYFNKRIHLRRIKNEIQKIKNRDAS